MVKYNLLIDNLIQLHRILSFLSSSFRSFHHFSLSFSRIFSLYIHQICNCYDIQTSSYLQKAYNLKYKNICRKNFFHQSIDLMHFISITVISLSSSFSLSLFHYLTHKKTEKFCFLKSFEQIITSLHLFSFKILL